jgi:hypothetical protein
MRNEIKLTALIVFLLTGCSYVEKGNWNVWVPKTEQAKKLGEAQARQQCSQQTTAQCLAEHKSDCASGATERLYTSQGMSPAEIKRDLEYWCTGSEAPIHTENYCKDLRYSASEFNACMVNLDFQQKEKSNLRINPHLKVIR